MSDDDYGPLEGELREHVWNVMRAHPTSLEAMVHGGATADAMRMADVLLTKLNAVEACVYRIAREIDESRA